MPLNPPKPPQTRTEQAKAATTAAIRRPGVIAWLTASVLYFASLVSVVPQYAIPFVAVYFVASMITFLSMRVP